MDTINEISALRNNLNKGMKKKSKTSKRKSTETKKDENKYFSLFSNTNIFKDENRDFSSSSDESDSGIALEMEKNLNFLEEFDLDEYQSKSKLEIGKLPDKFKCAFFSSNEYMRNISNMNTNESLMYNPNRFQMYPHRVYSNNIYPQMQAQLNSADNLTAHRYSHNFFVANGLIDQCTTDDKYILENALTLLKDQNGCRLIQKKIEEKNQDYVIKLFNRIQHSLPDIVNDQFANYVVQKVIDYVHNNCFIITKFFEIVKHDLYVISVNQFGTRVFQKILDYFCISYKPNGKINQILRDLILGHTLNLINDTNGNHVFQKIMMIYPRNKNQFIFDELSKVSIEIAMSKKGGCIFQRTFGTATDYQRRNLIQILLSQLKILINHEYGNFIIQQIIFLKDLEINIFILSFIRENLSVLARKKFSSNVIDKCIILDEMSYNIVKNEFIDYMIKNKFIIELIGDQFGNYIIQKTLQVTDGLRFKAIILEIKSVFKNLKKSIHGKKIFDILVKDYGKYLISSDKNGNSKDV